jgi:hypothetical protein
VKARALRSIRELRANATRQTVLGDIQDATSSPAARLRTYEPASEAAERLWRRDYGDAELLELLFELLKRDIPNAMCSVQSVSPFTGMF